MPDPRPLIVATNAEIKHFVIRNAEVLEQLRMVKKQKFSVLSEEPIYKELLNFVTRSDYHKNSFRNRVTLKNKVAMAYQKKIDDQIYKNFQCATPSERPTRRELKTKLKRLTPKKLRCKLLIKNLLSLSRLSFILFKYRRKVE